MSKPAYLMINGSCLSNIDAIPWKDLGYLAWHDRADRYYKSGQRQKRCRGCGLWRWDDEPCCDGAQRLTAKEDAAQTRAIARAVKKQYPSSSERYRKELQKARRAEAEE